MDEVMVQVQKEAEISLHKDFDLMDNDLRMYIQHAIYEVLNDTVPNSMAQKDILDYSFKVQKCSIPQNPEVMAIVTLCNKDKKVIRVYELHLKD